MRIYMHTLESVLSEQIATEIRFVIASARASGKELISLKINIDSDKDGKIGAALIKNLKSIKKEGRIDFFANREAFARTSAEASYLTNKFPEITELANSEDFFLIIKI